MICFKNEKLTQREGGKISIIYGKWWKEPKTQACSHYVECEHLLALSKFRKRKLSAFKFEFAAAAGERPGSERNFFPCFDMINQKCFWFGS